MPDRLYSTTKMTHKNTVFFFFFSLFRISTSNSVTLPVISPVTTQYPLSTEHDFNFDYFDNYNNYDVIITII